MCPLRKSLFNLKTVLQGSHAELEARGQGPLRSEEAGSPEAKISKFLRCEPGRGSQGPAEQSVGRAGSDGDLGNQSLVGTHQRPRGRRKVRRDGGLVSGSLRTFTLELGRRWPQPLAPSSLERASGNSVWGKMILWTLWDLKNLTSWARPEVMRRKGRPDERSGATCIGGLGRCHVGRCRRVVQQGRARADSSPSCPF